jgi:POT family proton-dependent oligopeptide transporter
MASYQPRTAPDPKETGWPSGVKYIIGNEGCERFSYYGMKAILFVYIVGLLANMQGLGEKEARDAATETMHLWSAAVYALPLIGAIISDRWLGKYRTILYLSMVYCVGHAALAIFEGPELQLAIFDKVLLDPVSGMYVGLFLIALGSGGIKPCVSAHVGDQFGKGNWHMVQKVYNAFYFIINFGSAFATIFIPMLRGKVIDVTVDGVVTRSYSGSVTWAFAVPGILMGLATICFWAGRKEFVHVPPTHPGKRGFLDVLSGTLLFLGFLAVPIWFSEFLGSVAMTVGVSVSCIVAAVVTYAARQKIEQDDGFLAQTFFCLKAKFSGDNAGDGEAPQEGRRDLRDHFFYGPAARRFGNELAEGPVAVWKIISVFILVSVFWGLFHQHSSTWIAQARDMDRSIDMGLNSWLLSGAGLGFITGYAFVLALKKKGTGLLMWAGGGAVIGLLLGWIGHRFGPYTLEASQVPAVNPFMVMLLIPYTAFGLYPLMERMGYEPKPLRRMTIGMLMAGLSFAAVAIIQGVMDGGTPLHVGWQLIPYLIITLAEVMVSITGLEFAYTQAPKRMKSVIMGFWLLNVTLGDLLVVFVTRIKFQEQTTFFWVFAGLMVAAGLLFGLRARSYEYQDYSQ